jgi:hypothetical protein
MDSEENSPWQYKSDEGSAAKDTDPSRNSAASSVAKSTAPKSVAWKASEYVEHQRGTGWYVLLIIITAVLAAAVYLVSKDKFATGVIAVVGVIVGVFASHKPTQINYEITDSGLSVAGKVYKYADFKSFAIVREGALSSVNLMPLRRFMPPISAYFEASDEPKIIGALGNYLPYEERKLDMVEQLSRRLRL